MYFNLRAEMVRKGYNVEKLGDKAGIKLSALYKKMQGINKFTLPECLRIKKALALDIPIETLFAWESRK